MTRRPHLLALAVLASAALVAGCGGSSNDNKSTSGGGGGGSSVSSNPQVKQAVASCKQSVDQAQRLSASIKSDLKKLCDKAGSGDAAAVRKASREVCVKIVEQNVPAGPGRDQAKSACSQGTVK